MSKKIKNGNFRRKKTLKREKKRKVSIGQPTYCKNFVLIFFYILKTFDVWSLEITFTLYMNCMPITSQVTLADSLQSFVIASRIQYVLSRFEAHWSVVLPRKINPYFNIWESFLCNFFLSLDRLVMDGFNQLRGKIRNTWLWISLIIAL